MDVISVINERKSSRAYLEKPIEKELLEQLLTLASRAPSAINLQPWEITIVAGEEKKRLCRVLIKRMKELNVSCAPGTMSALPQKFVQRQKKLFDILTPLMPEGKEFLEFINEGSCNFYGAPVAVIISIDKIFSSARLTDIGIFAGYFMLAAHALGLGTCPIGIITEFEEDIKEELNIPESKKVVLGVAVGYPDPNASINKVKSSRVQLSEFVRWRGI